MPHTPGPWQYLEAIETDYLLHPEIVSEDFTICELHEDMLDEEVVANGRLIAAAPDLLAALKQIDESWTADIPGGLESVPGGMDAINIHPTHLAFWKMARAAIRKATGQ